MRVVLRQTKDTDVIVAEVLEVITLLARVRLTQLAGVLLAPLLLHFLHVHVVITLTLMLLPAHQQLDITVTPRESIVMGKRARPVKII